MAARVVCRFVGGDIISDSLGRSRGQTEVERWRKTDNENTSHRATLFFFTTTIDTTTDRRVCVHV